MGYYGNSGDVYDHHGSPIEPDDDGPTMVLICDSCHREIDFYGDPAAVERIRDGAYQLEEWDLVRCACGATYRQDDWLDVAIG